MVWEGCSTARELGNMFWTDVAMGKGRSTLPNLEQHKYWELWEFLVSQKTAKYDTNYISDRTFSRNASATSYCFAIFENAWIPGWTTSFKKVLFENDGMVGLLELRLYVFTPACRKSWADERSAATWCRMVSVVQLPLVAQFWNTASVNIDMGLVHSSVAFKFFITKSWPSNASGKSQKPGQVCSVGTRKSARRPERRRDNETHLGGKNRKH